MLEIVGLLVLIVSVGFIGYELYQARQLAVSERLTTAAEVETSLRDLVAANHEIWLAGCMGEELSREEKTVFVNIYAALMYRSFTLWAISKTGTSTIPQDTAIDRIARSAAYFPGIRDVLLDHKEMARAGGVEKLTIEYLDAVLQRAEVYALVDKPEFFACGF